MTMTPQELSKWNAMWRRMRVDMVLDQPWFGQLSGHLPVRPNAGIPTACTNGRWIDVNPTFASGLTDHERMGVYMHEIMHCALLHPWRLKEYYREDPQLANEAADYVANALLRKSGYRLPAGALYNAEYEGMCVERIIGILQALPKEQRARAGDMQRGGLGEFEPDPGPGAGGDQGLPENGPMRQGGAPPSGANTSGSPEALAVEWEIAVKQANKLGQKMGGTGSADFFAGVTEQTRSRIDWKSVLLRFFQTSVPNDYTWARPNRRYATHGLYLPSLHSEGMGEVVIALDESGSISQHEFAVFIGDTASIIAECRPSRIHVLHFDTRVAKHETFELDEPLDTRAAKRYACGGTDYADVFAYVEREGLDPVCAVILTDNQPNAGWPTDIPAYPVLWISTCREPEAPWGENVYMDLQDVHKY